MPSEHLTSTGKALGISLGIEETEQFNHVAFMAELDQLQSLWTRAYKRAEYLANGIRCLHLPAKMGRGRIIHPLNIIELGSNIRRCLVHDDATKSITVQELQRAIDKWMCHTLHELYDEMELWQWNEVQHNRWARALKASYRGSSTNMVCRGLGAGRKTTELGNGD
jgi:hypothetical protein